MDYAIIATLGPSSDTPATWRALLAAGATGFRLNTSHLSLVQLAGWLERLAGFFSALDWPVPAVTLDLQGSKWRLGDVASIELQAGQVVELVQATAADRGGNLPVPHADFFRAAVVSTGEISLNDAKVSLMVETGGADWLRARVIKGGEISARKGITFTGGDFRIETLSEKDQAILRQAGSIAGVRYAISYVKDAAEMGKYRALCGPERYLVAKLERQPAVDEAGRIAGTADEVWLCRGDLGAELGLPGMAEAVHRFSLQVRLLPAPAMLAGQVLEHMTAQPAPTRSEVCYLYDALHNGYRGVVLSDETAIGRYPVESCQAAAMFQKLSAGNLTELKG